MDVVNFLLLLLVVRTWRTPEDAVALPLHGQAQPAVAILGSYRSTDSPLRHAQPLCCSAAMHIPSEFYKSQFSPQKIAHCWCKPGGKCAEHAGVTSLSCSRSSSGLGNTDQIQVNHVPILPIGSTVACIAICNIALQLFVSRIEVNMTDSAGILAELLQAADLIRASRAMTSRLVYVQFLHNMLLFSRHEYVLFAPLI